MKFQRKHLTIIIIIVSLLILTGGGLWVWWLKSEPDSDVSVYYSATPLLSYSMNRRNVLTKTGAMPNGAITLRKAGLMNDCFSVPPSRYLTIRRNNNEYLHVSEFDIFNETGGVISKTNMTATQSSQYSNNPASNVIDGSRSTFNHTQNGKEEYVKVDMKSPYTLSKVQVWNRGLLLPMYSNGKVVSHMFSVEPYAMTRFIGCYLVVADNYKNEIWRSPVATTGMTNIIYEIK